MLSFPERRASSQSWAIAKASTIKPTVGAGCVLEHGYGVVKTRIVELETIQVELSQVRSRVRSMILLDGYTMADVTVIRHVRSETLVQTNSSTVLVDPNAATTPLASFGSGD